MRPKLHEIENSRAFVDYAFLRSELSAAWSVGDAATIDRLTDQLPEAEARLAFDARHYVCLIELAKAWGAVLATKPGTEANDRAHERYERLRAVIAA